MEALETDALIDIPLEAEEITLGVTELTATNPYLLPAAGLVGGLGLIAGSGFLAGELAKQSDIYKGLASIKGVSKAEKDKLQKWKRDGRPLKTHKPSDYITSGAAAAADEEYRQATARSEARIKQKEAQLEAKRKHERDLAAINKWGNLHANRQRAKAKQLNSNKPVKTVDARVLADYIVEEPEDRLVLRGKRTNSAAVALSNTVVSGLFGTGPLQSLLIQLLQKYAHEQLSKGIDLTKEHLSNYAKGLWNKFKKKGLGGLFKSTEITKVNDKLSVVSKAPSAKYSSIVQPMVGGRMSAAKGGALVSRKSAPVSRSTKIVRRNAPRMSTRQGNIVISHSEMIGHVVSNSTGTYSVDSYRINAGDTLTFPWLSSIARNFEKYKFSSLGVAFVSGQATSMPGKVGLGIDYDPLDEPPSNRVEFFTLTAHTEAAPWDNLVLNIPCKGGFKFTDQSVDANTRLVDMGQLLVMNDLATADSILGDLIVSYTVELAEPQPKPSDLYCMETASQYPDECTDHSTHSFVKWSVHNTSTSQYFEVPMGYYTFVVAGYDPTSFSIDFEIRSGDGDGYRGGNLGSGSYPHCLGCAHMTKHEGEIKIATTIAYDTINITKITVSRIDKAVYDLLITNMSAMSSY